MKLRRWLRHLFTTGPVPTPEAKPVRVDSAQLCELADLIGTEFGERLDRLEQAIRESSLDLDDIPVFRVPEARDVLGRIKDVAELDRMFRMEAK